jgi:hypothetical protein
MDQIAKDNLTRAFGLLSEARLRFHVGNDFQASGAAERVLNEIREMVAVMECAARRERKADER